MEALLGLVRDATDCAGLAPAALPDRPAGCGRMSVVPRRLDQHPTQPGIAGLRDRSPADAPATGVFAWDDAAVRHALARLREAPALTDLRHSCHGRGLGDAV